MNLNTNKLNYINSILFVFLIAIIIFTNGCKKKQGWVSTGNAITDGKYLSVIYCGKCHKYPGPELLNKDVWINHTLPDMAPYLGLHSYMGSYFKNESDTAGLSLIEYQDIVAYYSKMAPDTLKPAIKPVKPKNDWAGFVLKKPEKVLHPAYLTMAAIDPLSHKIFTSDYIYADLSSWDQSLKQTAIAKLQSSALSAFFMKDSHGAEHAILSCTGRVEEVDYANGKIADIDLSAKRDSLNQTIFASDLARPVQTLDGDFNKDGLMDRIVLEKGNIKGGVDLFIQKPGHSFNEVTISNTSGAIQAVTGDFNNDGWLDVMVLFGKGDEGLCVFFNDKKGGFIRKNILTFPPVNGSSSFQLADLDHDGKIDLIYTCGYNFRDSRVLKPYHGLYLFKNLGDWKFRQEYFYPINGCTKAMATDFDHDGDMDIATIAFFADLQNNPAESFIYFEQTKPFNFTPHTIPVSKYGRWFTMDIGDYNNDGKPDIILGNYSTGFIIQPGLKPFWIKKLPFVVLENNIKK